LECTASPQIDHNPTYAEPRDGNIVHYNVPGAYNKPREGELERERERERE